jgi:hypothetical protein
MSWAPRPWVVEVNAGVITASGQGARWWVFAEQKFAPRITYTKAPTIVGGLAEIACDDRESADWLMGRALAGDVPQTAVRVKRAAIPGGGHG